MDRSDEGEQGHRITLKISTLTMDTNRKKVIIGGIAALVLMVIIAVLLLRDREGVVDVLGPQEVVVGEPIDIVSDFYNAWLDAAKSTSTDPYQSGLPAQPFLSQALREKLEASKGRAAEEIDPVLCRIVPPERVTVRPVFERDNEAQMLVLSRDKTQFEQTIVTVKRHNDGWYIDDVTCAPGEFAPEREFTFEKEGFLLKSVPPPLDPQYWHIVFEDNEELGHFAPLHFDGESMCKTGEGNETVCFPDQLTDTTKVFIQGQMTEAGVEVKHLTILKE